MEKNHWTTAEEALLRKHFPTMTARQIGEMMGRSGNAVMCKAHFMGLKKRRPYQMRHTAATLWLASGEAPEWIARQLGHSSTEMLFRVYSRYVPNLTRQDGSAIDRLLATRFATTNTLASIDSTAPAPADQVETQP